MKETKIQLSQAEMELMCNAEIILTKNKVMEKAKLLLEDIQTEMTGYIKQNTALAENHFFQNSPKISRGENYLGLPYLILDYPRKFEQESIAAIRTMFWWGHFFSITLHLTGSARILLQRKIGDHYTVLANSNYYIGINKDPWMHHFEKDNYSRLDQMTEEAFRQQCKEAMHLKIACKIPLHAWETAPDVLWNEWKWLVHNCLG